MRLSSILIHASTFASAAGLSLIVAGISATVLEQGTEIAVRRALDDAGFNWAEVVADGLRVELSGEAPDEASRFGAISHIGSVVDAARIIDQMEITPSQGIAPPRFSTEILRNDAGVSIIGLIPDGNNHENIIRQVENLVDGKEVTDFLETAAYPAPQGWTAALRYGLNALDLLPRSKISIEAGRVTITAIADSSEEKTALERQLKRMLPAAVHAEIDIAAPRPVISPFTLRYVLDENGGRFDACSVESAENEAKILRAAQENGLRGAAQCTIGLGVPSSSWTPAATLSINALSQLGNGSVTLSNTDVTLVAAQGTEPAQFDRVVGELETALPGIFALHAVLPEPDTVTGAPPPEFTATLSPEGQVQLRGRLSDDTLRQTVDSYAKARFGSDNVYLATRNVAALPTDWPVRVLTALEALSYLERGAVSVTADSVTLRGMSHDEQASADIARLLSDKLGEAEKYSLDVAYEAPPEPEDKPLAPELCEAELAAIQRADKITFEPGSATVAAGSARVLDKITALLEQCGPIPLEIQGHTDSQGRAEMNQSLSQARAQSILNALSARRLLTSSFVANGYGETTPIATNDTDEGREANRRIEFRLIQPETDEGAATTPAAPENSQNTAQDAANETEEASGQ